MLKKILIGVGVFVLLPILIITGLFLALGEKSETVPFQQPSLENLAKTNLSQIASPKETPNIGIGVLSWTVLKTPLFDDVTLTLWTDSTFKVWGKSFSFEQAKPLLTEDNLVILPYEIKEDESKVTYFFITSFVKMGNKFGQKQSIFLGNFIKVNDLDLKWGILHATFLAPAKGKKELDDTAVTYSKYFKYSDGQVAPYYPSINNGDIMDLAIIQNTWVWKETIASDGTKVTPSKPWIFTLNMNEEGNFSGTTNCNNLIGKFTMDEKNALFNNIAMTKMKCNDPTEQNTFASYLSDTKTYEYKDGKLTFKLNNGSIVQFEKATTK